VEQLGGLVSNLFFLTLVGKLLLALEGKLLLAR
jgi:hypothetical protein